MFDVDNLDLLFVATSFLFQVVLIVHFALRRWRFELALHYGWIVYALGALGAAVSAVLLLGGKPWSLWAGGFIYLIWAMHGYTVEYVQHRPWRDPIRWTIFGPYVFLYLAANMFYWFPLALVSRPLWYVYGLLFIVSTVLNITSHKRPHATSGQIGQTH
ncbi:MAG: hypothetical protein WCF84_19100 [Anaerolineae bacterium]